MSRSKHVYSLASGTAFAKPITKSFPLDMIDKSLIPRIEHPLPNIFIFMANQTLYYYFAPTWDFPPKGPLQLGNILMSVKKPERALYTAPLPDATEIITSEKSQVEFSREKLKGGKFSIFTRFIKFIGLGIDLAATWNTA